LRWMRMGCGWMIREKDWDSGMKRVERLGRSRRCLTCWFRTRK
jgi:hypothetical protein